MITRDIFRRPLVILTALLTLNTARGDEMLRINPLRAFGDQIADIVEQVLPSVVVIRTEAVRYQLARDFFFGQLYRMEQRIPGQGSGVIIDRQGYVLTSHHVVDNARQIEVVLDDGTVYEAELVGSDPHTDLAVVRILAEPDERFDAIEFGDSDALRVGEVVIALGSPFNLSSTVTMGIVSQKGRVIGMLPYEDFIQTQAPINPGNSGGPLVDADGRMVGINAAIHSGGARDAGNVGIGFAVPGNLAMRVAGSLIATGEIAHPWIGILMRPTVDGVEVEEVFRDSPAEQGGIQRGDVIRRINDRPVSSALEVRRSIFQHTEDTPITILIQRGEDIKALEISPSVMPNLDQFRR